MKAREKRPRKIRAVENSEAPPAAENEAAQEQEEAVEVDHPISHAAPAMPDESSEEAAAGATEAAEASAEDTEALAHDADESPVIAPADDAQAPAAEGGTTESIAPPVDCTRGKAVLESLIFVSERTVTAVQLGRAAKIKSRAGARAARRADARVLEPRHRADRGRGRLPVPFGARLRRVRARVRRAEAGPADSAQLETLALIAYRQPMTRPEIDDVRGVDSGSAIRVLLERNLIKMLGRKDEPGRPLLYGTSGYFLEFFGMRSLKDLPTLREFTDLSEESRALFKRKTGEAIEEAEADAVRRARSSGRRSDRAHLGRGPRGAGARSGRGGDADAEAAPPNRQHRPTGRRSRLERERDRSR